MIEKGNFVEFCEKLAIPTKEYGVIALRLRPIQLYAIDRLLEGIEAGVHYFYFLKCRQALCSTWVMAFDLYWAFACPGTIGMVVTDADERRTYFNHVVRTMVKALSGSDEWRVPVRFENRGGVSFVNDSSLIFANANSRKKGQLGMGTGLSLVHGSECASWEDEEGWMSLHAALAKHNPNRIFIFESTAKGDNLWKRNWDAAQDAVSMRGIFLGWWLQEEYRCEVGSREYEVYWDGAFNEAELEWRQAVATKYGYWVSPEQVAWYRWQFKEYFHENIGMMLQEYPWLDSQAFRFSGSSVISYEAISRARTSAALSEGKCSYFRFSFGSDFESCKLEEANASWHDLSVWEGPTPNARYVIGCDPAHGTSARSDAAVIQVLRAYYDRLEQVAEFSARGLPTYQLGWALFILVAAYSDAHFNIEVQGGGDGVIDEMDRIRAKVGAGYPDKLSGLLASASPYFYRRSDSLSRGTNMIHTVTTERVRHEMIQSVIAAFQRGVLIVNSPGLCDEAANLIMTEEGRYDVANQQLADDRVMALGLALTVYQKQLIWMLDPRNDLYSERKMDEDVASHGQSLATQLRRGLMRESAAVESFIGYGGEERVQLP